MSASGVDEQRVLIVEDDGLLRDAYRLALEKAGFAVLEVADGRGALDLLSSSDREGLSLVVLDIGLPDIDGLELLHRIREDHDDRALPILVVTGADELEHRIEGLASGASDYVVKPVALSELVARVKAHVRTVDHWRAQVAGVVDTRTAIASDLAAVRSDGDFPAAAQVIAHAASRIPDVAGAAFLLEDESFTVASAVGDAPLAPGSDTARVLRSHIAATVSSTPAVTTRAALGVGGPGRVVLVPLVVASRREGLLAASLSPRLAPDRAQAAASALGDLAVMAAPLVTPCVNRARADAERRDHHARTIRDQAFSTVFQPIVDLSTSRVAGFEALTRFDSGIRPDLVFADAAAVGMREELERATAALAVDRAAALPVGAYVSVNVSAATALDSDFLESLIGGDREVVIEITEHDAVDDYGALEEALAAVRSRARVAVDDAGAGYAGLSHIRSLRPDLLKLDRSLVSGIDADPVGRAMIAGVIHFAAEIGCRVIAEGVETEDELGILVELGVSHGQGYLLGRPGPPPEGELVNVA